MGTLCIVLCLVRLSFTIPAACTAYIALLTRRKFGQGKDVLAHPAEAQAIRDLSTLFGVGCLVMLLTYVILAFPELGDGAEILADVAETGAQGVAGGAEYHTEGCEGLRLFHFDPGWSRSQIGNLFELVDLEDLMMAMLWPQAQHHHSTATMPSSSTSSFYDPKLRDVRDGSILQSESQTMAPSSSSSLFHMV